MQGTSAATVFLSIVSEFPISLGGPSAARLFDSVFHVVISVVWAEARADCIRPAVHSSMCRWIHLRHFQDCEVEVMKATLCCEDKAEISQGFSPDTHTHTEYFKLFTSACQMSCSAALWSRYNMFVKGPCSGTWTVGSTLQYWDLQANYNRWWFSSSLIGLSGRIYWRFSCDGIAVHIWTQLKLGPVPSIGWQIRTLSAESFPSRWRSVSVVEGVEEADLCISSSLTQRRKLPSSTE